MSNFQRDEWQYAASMRLQALLTRRKLQGLLSDFEKTLRADRREDSGEDRPSNNAELADALLVVHDVDLLSKGNIRSAIANAAQTASGQAISNPARWVPGRPAAIRFTEAVGLPIVLAGTPSPPPPESTYTVVPPANHKPLEDYQAQVSYEMYRRMRAPMSPDNRAIVSLPTGAGKTRVAVETIHQWVHDMINEGVKRKVAVAWLAHTEELCEQAVACFDEVWRSKPGGQLSLRIARYWSKYRKNLLNSDSTDELILDSSTLVIVSTPQSFNSREDLREELHQRLDVDAIIIDEAHRAAAPTYRSIIAKHGSRATLIGLTATPFRNVPNQVAPLEGTRELKEVFKNLILPYALGDDPRSRLETLQSRGILSRPLVQTVQTNITLNVNTERESTDSPSIINYDQALQQSADQTRRRRKVIKEVLRVLEHTSTARILYFGPTVKDAELVAFLLRSKGKRAAAVSSSTKDTTRRAIVNDFRRGRIDILCNCEVLTAGFDAPQVSHVIMARPTISQILYEQMVGRGLRGPRFGGTEHCVIVDFNDTFHANRPELGWEGFRAVWEPEAYEPERVVEHIGLLFELSPTKLFRASRSREGISTLSFKPAKQTIQLLIQVSLFGNGIGRLILETAPARNDDAGSTATVTLDSNNRVQRTTIQIKKNHALSLHAYTSTPDAHIEVRRA